MAFEVRITPEAEQDATAILDWLAAENAGETGLKWFYAMNEAINSLAEMPQRCRLAPENQSFPFLVQELQYGNKPHIYRILFTIEDGSVYLLHIRHGRRLPITM